MCKNIDCLNQTPPHILPHLQSPVYDQLYPRFTPYDGNYLLGYNELGLSTRLIVSDVPSKGASLSLLACAAYWLPERIRVETAPRRR
jgi:hypothetical protein